MKLVIGVEDAIGFPNQNCFMDAVPFTLPFPRQKPSIGILRLLCT